MLRVGTPPAPSPLRRRSTPAPPAWKRFFAKNTVPSAPWRGRSPSQPDSLFAPSDDPSSVPVTAPAHLASTAVGASLYLTEEQRQVIPSLIDAGKRMLVDGDLSGRNGREIYHQLYIAISHIRNFGSGSGVDPTANAKSD